MKVFLFFTLAGFALLRLSPWFWQHSLPSQRAALIGAVLAAAGLLSLGCKALRRLGRSRQSRRRAPVWPHRAAGRR